MISRQSNKPSADRTANRHKDRIMLAAMAGALLGIAGTGYAQVAPYTQRPYWPAPGAGDVQPAYQPQTPVEPSPPAQVDGQAQNTPPAAATPAPVVLNEQQLDQLVAPVALYPDPLLAQLFPAAGYPLDVVEADRWVQANVGFSEDQLNGQSWEAPVKALAHYPSVLKYMSVNLRWTQSLGAAFLAQQQDVLAAVQRQRQRALAAGNLANNQQQQVINQSGVIYLEPANPQVVYVPTYDPNVIYYRNDTTAETWYSGIPSGTWFDLDFDWDRHHVVRGRRDWDHDRWHWREQRDRQEHQGRDDHLYQRGVVNNGFHPDDHQYQRISPDGRIEQYDPRVLGGVPRDGWDHRDNWNGQRGQQQESHVPGTVGQTSPSGSKELHHGKYVTPQSAEEYREAHGGDQGATPQQTPPVWQRNDYQPAPTGPVVPSAGAVGGNPGHVELHHGAEHAGATPTPAQPTQVAPGAPRTIVGPMPPPAAVHAPAAAPTPPGTATPTPPQGVSPQPPVGQGAQPPANPSPGIPIAPTKSGQPAPQPHQGK